MEQSFKIPPLPAILAQNKVAILGCLPSHGSKYDSGVWNQWFDGDPDVPAIVSEFPSSITRDQVASLYHSGNFRRLFLATMIWGYSTSGFGPYRTKKILSYPQTDQKIQIAAELVAEGKVKVAYESMEIPRLGPAFFTKLLYFIGLGAKIEPLPVILDSRVASGLEILGIQERWDFTVFVKVGRNKSNEINVKRFSEGYIRYVKTLDQWSMELGCPHADHVEYFLFRLARSVS